MSKEKIGTGFDDFLNEEGILGETEAVAVKRILTWQLEQARKHANIDKETMAIELETSRAQVNKLFAPSDTSVTLKSIVKAARLLGKRVDIRLCS